jgi:predicted transcriptional regulator of viral defense system
LHLELSNLLVQFGLQSFIGLVPFQPMIGEQLWHQLESLPFPFRDLIRMYPVMPRNLLNCLLAFYGFDCRSIFVFTSRPFRAKEQIVQGVSFTLKRIPQRAIFGIKTLWSGQTQVPISDKARTIVDLLADPATGGGIRHVADCLRSYLRDLEVDCESLIRHAEILGNGAVFKRLGFLASLIEGNETLVQLCRQRLTQGNSKLDPTLPCPRLVKIWRLWIPKNWEVITASITGASPC